MVDNAAASVTSDDAVRRLPLARVDDAYLPDGIIFSGAAGTWFGAALP